MQKVGQANAIQTIEVIEYVWDKCLKFIWKDLKSISNTFVKYLHLNMNEIKIICICIWKLIEYLHLHLNTLKSIWPQVWFAKED